MKRKIIALAVLVAAIFTFSACEGGSDGGLCFHNWEKIESEETLFAAATCLAPATYLQVCSKCGAKGSPYESGEKADHSYVNNAKEETLAVAATCTAQASYYESCEYCDKLGEKTFTSGAMKPHNYQNIAMNDTVVNGATCSTSATYRQSCTECGARNTIFFQLGPAIPHTDTDGDFMCDHCLRPLKVFDDVPVNNLAGRHEFAN